MSNNGVGIFRWDNNERAFVPLALLRANEQTNSVVIQNPLAKKIHSRGFTATVCLPSSNIPIRASELLPGGFANKLLQAADPTWDKSDDFTKLLRLGSRDIGCYRLIVNNSALDESLVVGQEKLDEVMGKVHIATTEAELNTLLSSDHFYSLTATKGSRPKIEYQDEEGERWVVKTNDTKNIDESNALAKMEFATALMQEDINGEITMDVHLHKCPDGRFVLMTKRYDLAEPILNGNGIAEHWKRYDTINAKTMGIIASLEKGAAPKALTDYSDIVAVLPSFITNDYELQQTKIKLMRRALFDLAINNTGTSANHYDFIEDDESSVRYHLAPALGVVPDSLKNPFGLTIGKKYSSQLGVQFNESMVSDFSKVFDVSPEEVRACMGKVANVVLHRDNYMNMADMKAGDKAFFESAFLPNEVLQSAVDNYEPQKPKASPIKEMFGDLAKQKHQLTME